jgi:hypothetical protein
MHRWRLCLNADDEVVRVDLLGDLSHFGSEPRYHLNVTALGKRAPELGIVSVFCVTTQDELSAFAEWLKWKDKEK